MSDGVKRRMVGYEAFMCLVMGFCGHKTKLDQPTEEIDRQKLGTFPARCNHQRDVMCRARSETKLWRRS